MNAPFWKIKAQLKKGKERDKRERETNDNVPSLGNVCLQQYFNFATSESFLKTRLCSK